LTRFISIFFVLLLVVSCKPKATIITSKAEAQKRGIYRVPENKTLVINHTQIEDLIAKAKITPPIKAVVPTVVPEKKAPKYILNEANDPDYFVSDDDASYLVQQLIHAASNEIGTPYRSGGTSSGGFDCSGLMYSTFLKFDIELPRSSAEMARLGKKLTRNEVKKGDLIFFTTRGKRYINHVGMVVEVTPDEIKFVHSSTQQGVVISSTAEPYYARTFAQVNRVLE
jgi:cell wall-associated NlpC family hydrolase